MRKKLSFLPIAVLCLLLCACSSANTQEEDALRDALPTVPTQEQVAPAPAADADDESAEEETFVPIPDGIYAQDGAAYYYQDGAPLTASGLTQTEAGNVYVLADGSLFAFETGVNACEQTLYYHTGERSYVLSAPEAGIFEDASGVYLVKSDGSLAANEESGYLYFGADGRYTSGSETIDAGVADLFAACGATRDMDAAMRLRLCYDYIRDNYTYISMAHYDAGTTEWAQEAAEAFLRQGKGNCYCFAALFMYCARRLGYQAYVVAGHESRADNDHAWTMIDEEDGTYLYDVQLEYAYLYLFNKGAVDVFRASEQDGLYNGFAYFFP